MAPRGLSHMAQNCPGLNDETARTVVQPKTMASLLASERRIVIPIFQRRYVWPARLAEKWFEDALKGSTGGHRTGQTFFRRVAQGESSVLLCVDGQQRVTTTLLLCASVRDALRSWAARHVGHPDAGKCLEAANDLERTLFSGDEAMDEDSLAHAAAALQDGDDLPPCRLLPSFPDRRAFFRLIAPRKDGVLTADDEPPDPDDDMTSLASTRRTFDTLCEPLDSVQLLKLARSSTYGMTIMFMEIVTPHLDLPQVFLYLQEKALLSAGTLLYNPTPGIKFEALDLVRNLYLANFANEPVEEQEKIYRRSWLPLERMCPLRGDFDLLLSRFLTLRKLPRGELESHLLQTEAFLRSKGVKARLDSAVLYAQFWGYYDDAVSFRGRKPEDVINELAAFAGVVSEAEAVDGSMTNKKDEDMVDDEEEEVGGTPVSLSPVAGSPLRPDIVEGNAGQHHGNGVEEG